MGQKSKNKNREARVFVKQKSLNTGKENNLERRNWKNIPLLWSVLILLVTFIAFSPVLKNGFTNWDDTVYVTNNELLKDISLDGIKAIFTTPVSSHYHPLTILSLALNYQASGLNATSFLLTNLIFHLLNTLLVFYFIFRLTGKKLIPAIVVSLFFGIHPMHVESVAWISERKDVLYTFFLLPGLLFYLKYQDNPKIRNYLLVLLFFVLSLLSKPSAMIFPLLLILIDFLQFKPITIKKYILEKIPFFLLALGVALLALKNQSVQTISEERFSSFESFLFGCYGFVIYIVKLVVPFKLSALHPFPENSNLGTFYYIAPFLSLTLFFLVFKCRKSRFILFGLGFYLIAVFPFLQFFPFANAVIADRYTYLPYIGLLFIIGVYLDKLFCLKNKYFLLPIIIIPALIFMFLTNERTRVWNNSEVLWTDVIEKYPHSYRAYMSRGGIYLSEGKYEKAIGDLSRSLEINPVFTQALEFRGIAYNNTKEYDLALSDLQKWKKDEPENPDVYIHLAIALKGLNNPDEALSFLNQAITIDPANVVAFANRGTIYFNDFKDYLRALDDFNRAIIADPNYGLAYYNRANCFLMLGDKIKAQENANKAIELGVNVPQRFFEYLK